MTHEVTSNRLSRVYRIRGLDRVLYNSAPIWTEGTFEQSEEFEGLLRLHVDDISGPAELQFAIEQLDGVAERFRLAISKRTGCPLTKSLAESHVPRFDAPGVASIEDTVHLSDSAECTVSPRTPPSSIEQLHEGAARWVHTITEARTLSGYPDEVLKRMFLIIEELKDVHLAVLDAADVAAIDELAMVRDFVSHPICNRRKVSAFIAERLPSAIASAPPALSVRYDRTDVEHRNFVGGFDPPARAVVNKLLAAAIAALP